MKIKRTVCIAAAAAALGYVAADIYKNASIKTMPEHAPSDKNDLLVHELLLCFDNPAYAKEKGIIIDEKYITDAIYVSKKNIDGRYDCVDFRMQTLLRLAYLYKDKIKSISPRGWELLEQTFLGAKYWMTEPGDDSACYWSENHQLLYAVAEYLAGQMWPDKVFVNDGSTGREHKNRAEKRIGYWTEQRFYFGYSEFNSSNYYLFDAAPASNFIQFAQGCDELKERMKICLDLLFYDIASGIYDYGFNVPTGRAYAYNLGGGESDKVRKLTNYVWGLNDNYVSSSHHMLINIVSMLKSRDENGKPYYEVPPVIIEIGRDKSERVIKSSTGLDVSELKSKGLIGHDDYSIMYQFSIEAFTNPEVVYNTYTYFKENGLFTNSLVNYFRILNLKLFSHKKLMTCVSSSLNPMPNGIAIQRVNLYKYRTGYYMLAGVQKFHPGIYGAQQRLSSSDFGGNSIVFTSHPARDEDRGNTKKIPGYWSGFGRAPHIAQDKNVQLMIFDIPMLSGFLELYKVPQYTHTYLPEAFFDEVCIDGSFAFASKGGAYLALIGTGNIYYRDFDEKSAKAFDVGLEKFPDRHFDLVQNGRHQCWIYELSDETHESFAEFKQRIMKNTVAFNGSDCLQYISRGKTYELVFGGDFTVDEKVFSPQYGRFESDYIKSEREADAMNFNFAGHTLTLDYNKALRKFN